MEDANTKQVDLYTEVFQLMEAAITVLTIPVMMCNKTGGVAHCTRMHPDNWPFG